MPRPHFVKRGMRHAVHSSPRDIEIAKRVILAPQKLHRLLDAL
jgi:hypothetical protein